MTSTIDQELGERILFASKIMVNILAEALIEADIKGLTTPQYRILDLIYTGVDKPTELARMLEISPPALSWILTKLEEGGFLSREHSEEDRRRVVIELTDRGMVVVSMVNARRRKLINAVLNRMDEQDVRQLEISLKSFTSSYLQTKNDGQAGDRA